MTDIENFAGIEPFKGIKSKQSAIGSAFAALKFNNKKPKYNYISGMLAGIIVSKAAMLKGCLEGGDKIETSETLQQILYDIIDGGRQLAETYNWNLFDLENLINEFFGKDAD